MTKRRLLITPTVCVILLISSCLPGRNSFPSPQGSEPASTLVPVEKVLSTFSPIAGTNYLMAGINATADPTQRGGNPLEWILQSSYSSYGFNTYNFVFFNIETETYHRLLPSNDTVIVNATSFPVIDNTNTVDPKPTLEWWLFSIAKEDTNKNGQLGFGDKLTLSVSDVGGNGYTELIADVDSALSSVYKDDGSLFVIYNADHKNYVAKIDLPARKVLSTAEMDLGKDVK